MVQSVKMLGVLHLDLGGAVESGDLEYRKSRSLGSIVEGGYRNIRGEGERGEGLSLYLGFRAESNAMGCEDANRGIEELVSD